MKNTRFMERLFSAVNEGDEQLVNQVAADVDNAAAGKPYEDEEVSYVSLGEGKVLVTDKGNDEQTIIEKAEDGNYDMQPAEVAMPSAQIEGFAHPAEDGVTPSQVEGAADEHVEEHIEGSEGVAEQPEAVEPAEVQAEEHAAEECPKCGKNPCECEHEGEAEEEEHQYSNTIIRRIFSDQDFCERLFSEVIESEETSNIGDLKIEKVEGESAVIVTSSTTGDQAKVELTDDSMNVTELESKNFSGEEGEEEHPEVEEEGAEISPENPLHIVGVDPENHLIINAAEYDVESAQELAQALTERGVDAVEILDSEEEACDYAYDLLSKLGACNEDGSVECEEEASQHEFSDHTIYLTRYFSTHTILMDRLFSEACASEEGECPSRDAVEEAIKGGEEVENDGFVITPISDSEAIIKDKENGEYTKAEVIEEGVDFNPISDEDAEKAIEEKEFSNIACNEEGTKFFSIHEEMTEYMQRIFSGDADEKEIESAIEEGEQIENDKEIITPVDAETAVIEDKENGEFTKAVMDDEKLDLQPISEEEADKLTEGLAVEDKEEDEEKKEEVKEGEEEKKYSMNVNTLDRFFSSAGLAAPVEGAAPAEETTQEVKLQPGQSVVIVDEEGNPVEQPAEEEAAAEAQPALSVEAIEDKALAAVQSIQAAAAEAQSQILNAKAAPAENQEADLAEAQFSEKNFSETNDTLVSWLNGNAKH